jgi:hypothetical protein
MVGDSGQGEGEGWRRSCERLKSSSSIAMVCTLFSEIQLYLRVKEDGRRKGIERIRERDSL